jgi:hypothetical protein
MMKFDSFYFLHIPKTGGRYFINSYLKDMEPIFNNNSIDILYREYGHMFWRPDVKDTTYIFTTMRDPIKRTVSHYCHIAEMLDKFGKKHGYEITPEVFISWVRHREKMISNYQAKSFLYHNLDFSKAYTYKMHKNEEIEFDIDKEALYKNFNRVDFKVKIESFEDNKDTIINKIFSDLGIADALNTTYINKFENNDSNSLYLSLSEDDKEYLRSILQIDYELYDSIEEF